MVRVSISKAKVGGHDACWIRVNALEGEDEDLAYAEYVKKLDKCSARIGVLAPIRVPLGLFLALLRATAEKLGNVAVAVAEGILVVYTDGLFKPGEVIK